MSHDSLIIAGKKFQSRLIVGTGKYSSPDIMVKAHEASGAEMITVAVRRINITDRSQGSLLDYIDTTRYHLLPNTAGCYTAEDAVRTARLGREAGLSEWVKLEVIGDERTLFPDNEALLEATHTLVSEGFVVLPYTNDDPVICRKLEEAGAAAVMPSALLLAQAWESKIQTISRLFGNQQACLSSSMQELEQRQMLPSRWSLERTQCS